MRKLVLTMAVSLLVALLQVHTAVAATQINFDNVSDGTLIKTSYSAQGVTFDCHLGSDSTLNGCTNTNSTGFGGNVYARTPTAFGVSSTCNPGWIPDPAFAKSQPNVISPVVLKPCPGDATFFNAQVGYVVARFSTAVTSVSIFADAIFPPEFLGTTTNMPYMNAYDSSGHFLKTVEYSSSPISGSLGWVQMTITSAMVNNVPIGMVVFSSSYVTGSQAIWGEFDNLSFTLPTATVPNVVGMTLANAQSAITAAKLVVGTVSRAPSATVPAGDVISQNPAGGTTATVGSAVKLVVSCGPQATVPNVLGQTQAAAQTVITAAKLVVGTVTKKPSTTVPSGDVSSQSPVGGTTVCQGSKVNLAVSCGPPTTVPNLVGMTQTAAQTALTTAKLLLGSVVKKPSTTVPSGDVISQTPVGGTVVCQNSNVNLAVSCGLPTTVPNVVGLPAPTAKNDIIAAHLVVGTITTAHSSTIPAGDVISTNPKGGTVVCQGTVVNGVVSLGP